MMVLENPNDVRQQIAAEVESQARKDGIQHRDDLVSVCEARIAKAFVKARLCPKQMNHNHKRIAAAYAAQIADNLRKS